MSPRGPSLAFLQWLMAVVRLFLGLTAAMPSRRLVEQGAMSTQASHWQVGAQGIYPGGLMGLGVWHMGRRLRQSLSPRETPGSSVQLELGMQIMHGGAMNAWVCSKNPCIRCMASSTGTRWFQSRLVYAGCPVSPGLVRFALINVPFIVTRGLHCHVRKSCSTTWPVVALVGSSAR